MFALSVAHLDAVFAVVAALLIYLRKINDYVRVAGDRVYQKEGALEGVEVS